MLLTDRFLCSHRLEWLCLFLGCGLSHRLVLNARCLTAGGYTHSVQECGVASRGRCNLNCVTGASSSDQFNDLSFDPFEISPNCYDEEEIWSHAGVEQTAVEAEVKNGLKTEPQMFF